jgi:hypothetical protein
MDTARLGTSQDQATIQAFQKRLLERERTIARQSYQIEVMSSQLDALKRIDQDIKGQRRPVPNLMNVAPSTLIVCFNITPRSLATAGWRRARPRSLAGPPDPPSGRILAPTA